MAGLTAAPAAWLLSTKDEAGSDVVMYRSAPFSDLYSDSRGSAMAWRQSPDEEQLAGEAQAAGRRRSAIGQKLKFLETYARLEEAEVQEENGKVGLSLHLRSRADGEVFVCQAIIFQVKVADDKATICHVHEDVTSTVSVDHLLSAAGTGEFFDLIRARRKALGNMGSITSMRRSILAIQEVVSTRDYAVMAESGAGPPEPSALSADPDSAHEPLDAPLPLAPSVRRIPRTAVEGKPACEQRQA